MTPSSSSSRRAGPEEVGWPKNGDVSTPLIGIDRDDLPHIFKPFYRGQRAVDAQVRGTGVGLSVVRHVIEAHRGTVHVDSRPGEGTVMTPQPSDQHA